MANDAIPTYHGVRGLTKLMKKYTGNTEQFVQVLMQEKISHISYSSVTSVEFCHFRYYLEFVRQIALDPVPLYFVKGKAFHHAAAVVYDHLRETGTIDQQAVSAAAQSADAETQGHVLNAVTLLIENAIRDWEIVAIEEPFVMSVSRALPPCVGIIDLVLRRDDDFMIVDHKTGRIFYEHDEFQLALYREYIRRRFAPRSCMTVIDQYRWVNDLGRIRKPAFQRQYVTLSENAWNDARKRMSAAYRVMQQIATKGPPEKVGECYMCPFAGVCRK